MIMDKKWGECPNDEVEGLQRREAKSRQGRGIGATKEHKGPKEKVQHEGHEDRTGFVGRKKAQIGGSAIDADPRGSATVSIAVVPFCGSLRPIYSFSSWHLSPRRTTPCSRSICDVQCVTEFPGPKRRRCGISSSLGSLLSMKVEREQAGFRKGGGANRLWRALGGDMIPEERLTRDGSPHLQTAIRALKVAGHGTRWERRLPACILFKPAGQRPALPRWFLDFRSNIPSAFNRRVETL